MRATFRATRATIEQKVSYENKISKIKNG